MSPEMLKAKDYKAGYDFAADWWALGTLMYELLVGKPPFYLDDQLRMTKHIRKKKLNWKEADRFQIKISEEGKDLIFKLLIKEPDNRMGSNGDIDELLKHPWFSDVDVDRLLKKEIEPSFKPKVKDDHKLVQESMKLSDNTPVGTSTWGAMKHIFMSGPLELDPESSSEAQTAASEFA